MEFASNYHSLKITYCQLCVYLILLFLHNSNIKLNRYTNQLVLFGNNKWMIEK